MFGHQETAQATVLYAQDVTGQWEDIHHVKIEFVLEVHPPNGQAFRAKATHHFIRFTHSPQVGDVVTVKYHPKSLEVELDLKDDLRSGEKRWQHKQQAERQAAQARRDALLAAPPGTPHQTKEHWLEEGNGHFALQQYDEALVAYEQALHLDLGFVTAWSNKGMVFLMLKRYDEALATFEQVLHLDPTNASVWNNKAVALRDLERYDEALVAYEQALRLNPDEAIFHNGQGKVLEALGRSAEAEQAFYQARQLGYTG